MKFKYGTRRKALEYEKDIAEQWKKNKTFEKSVEQRDPKNAYVFYDGPPFITGNPHHGTLLSSIIKDIIPRYQTMKGKRVERVWGWDCHGLPAENFTEKHLGGTVSRKAGGNPDELILKSGDETKEISLESYITTARDLMVANSESWESTIDRIGRWVDFKGAYKTMDKDFMESVWWAFAELYKKGKIYEGEKVLMYDTKFATPVSKAEVTMDNDAYQTVTDPSVFVKFRVDNVVPKSERLVSYEISGVSKTITLDITDDIRKIDFPETIGNLKLKEGEFHLSLLGHVDKYDLDKATLEKLEKISKEAGKEMTTKPKLTGEFLRLVDDERDRETIIALMEWAELEKWQEKIRKIVPNADFVIPHTTIYTDGCIGIGYDKENKKFERALSEETAKTLREVSERKRPEKHLLAWTTTPWTLPANMALAVNPKMKYVEAEVDGENLILARDLVEKVLVDEKRQALDYKIVREMTGKDLVGTQYVPLFPEENASVVSKTAQKVFLIPGKHDAIKEKYYPKLKKQLESDGYDVTIVNYLDPHTPQLDAEVANYAKYDFADAHIIGHSLAAPTFLAYLARNDIKVQSLTLIAPAYPGDTRGGNEEWNEKSGYNGFELNYEDLKKKIVSQPVIIYSNDLEHRVASQKKLGENLGAKMVYEEGKGHFFNSEPELKDREPDYKFVFAKNQTAHKIYPADFVENEGGTGIVHIAPAYGEDDFALAQKNHIPVKHVIDDNGNYFPDTSAKLYELMPWKDATQLLEVWENNKDIAKGLAKAGIVWKIDYIQHEYPFNPRSKQRIMYRAIPTWFFEIQGQKPLMLAKNQNINWFPPHIKNGRFAKNIDAAPDWNLSRNRFWATAMPVWKGDRGTVRVVGSYAELEELSGVKLDDYHRPWVDKIEFDLTPDGRPVRHSELVSESKKYKFVILHGTEGTPESNWFPWLRKELEKRGHEVFVPKLPTPENQSVEKWCEALQKQTPWVFGKDTVLIGHSCGATYMLNILNRDRPEPIVASIFVSGFLHDLGNEHFDKLNHTFTHQDFDFTQIKKYAGETFVFAGDNDPYVPMSETEELTKKLGVKPNVIKNGGHLNSEFGYMEFPELLEKIDWILKQVQNDSVETEHFTRVEEVLDGWFESGSMPFAQFHYPFENKEKFEANYPADFIVEYIPQVRAWFYYVHAIGVAIFGENAYKNVVVTGTIAGNDGRKMSKSLGNYTDPMEIMDKYSADSLRFLLASSPLLSAEDFSLKDKDVSDVARKLSMIWNMYDFFTMYASVDGWDSRNSSLADALLAHRAESTARSVTPAASTYTSPATTELSNVLDKWIVSRIHQLGEHIEKYLDEYNLPDAMSAILPFVDDMSNWYVRRSRRRFWKSEDDADKMQAYQTLHYVLVRLSMILAPFCPFLAEELYQKLTGGESVHLHDWPKEMPIDEKVLAEMARTRAIIEQGLALRMNREDEFGQIKVRQPLSQLTYIGEKLDDFYEQIIAEEVNVKTVRHSAGVASQKPEENSLDSATGKPTQNDSVQLDKKITPELKREGQSREIIRVIQTARKDAGLNVDDRIVLDLATDDTELQQAIEDYKKTILDETLATKLAANDGHKTIVKVDGIELVIYIKKKD
ncbi:hypothetical protein FACS189431_5350 [Alphaproteobacteria bacterium]|nr:hypothetical protein FACS189431_5350 [Alphaproteobacteria bacterium]